MSSGPKQVRSAGGPTIASCPMHLDESVAPARVVIDPAWRPLVEEVCKLKEALDHATKWPEIADELAWVDTVLKRYGLHIDDFKGKDATDVASFPDNFLANVLGRWVFSIMDVIFDGVADNPEWSVVGWVWREHHQRTSELGHEEIAAKALEVLSVFGIDNERVTTIGFEGMPLLWAGEGKNRTQLFRLAGVPRRSDLRIYRLPNLSGCVARPLWGMPGMTVLSTGRQSQVLPFGDLSRRLLTAFGVRWEDKPALSGWTRMCSKGRSELGVFDVIRLAGNEKRLRLALIGGRKLAGLAKSGE